MYIQKGSPYVYTKREPICIYISSRFRSTLDHSCNHLYKKGAQQRQPIYSLCCSVLQCVAACCSVLQCFCSVSQCVAVCCSVLQRVAACCSNKTSCPTHLRPTHLHPTNLLVLPISCPTHPHTHIESLLEQDFLSHPSTSYPSTFPAHLFVLPI